MKNLIVSVLFMLCVVFSASAQTEKGFGGKVEAGYGFNAGDSFNEYHVNLMPTYHFNSAWSAGIGVGYKSLDFGTIADTKIGSMNIIPLFAHVQWNVATETPIIPFIGIKAGYAIGSKDIVPGATLKTRAITSGEIGAKYSLGSAAIFLSVSYEYLDTDLSTSVTRFAIASENQTIGINLGVEF